MVVARTGRFAPSTTGEAHPGTLLSALLVWLDMRSRDGRVLLRLEDLDITRVKPAWSKQLVEACAFLGLDWDAVVTQSDRRAAHEAALDRLADAGRLYACTCSRARRSGGRPAATAAGGPAPPDNRRRAPDGGWAYDNTCRAQVVAEWRTAAGAIRCRLPDERVVLVDDGGLELSQTPAYEMGDPVVRRRDGVIAYQLAVVVDDADAAITDIVRGRDIAPSTATQVLLQRLLGLPTPHYRHHFLILERAEGDKLAKLHGSMPFSKLRVDYPDGAALCGKLAQLAGLRDTAAPCTPRELVADFDWARVTATDVVWR
ncbi:MAG TPA: glutamate--tRNA ligase family protein [Kofleriaceae bacterium]|nr:glutamate--tRNA ligase family protein [Kofleriaceae bacterium]